MTDPEGTTLSIEQVLAKHADYVRNLDDLCQVLSEKYGNEMKCRPGCTDCCHEDLTVFPIEAASIRRAFESLSGARKQHVRDHLEGRRQSEESEPDRRVEKPLAGTSPVRPGPVLSPVEGSDESELQGSVEKPLAGTSPVRPECGSPAARQESAVYRRTAATPSPRDRECGPSQHSPCPLLFEGLCLLYPARPLLCRTEGFLLANKSPDTGEWTISACPQNFGGLDPEKEVPAGDLINLGSLNHTLAILNHAYVVASGWTGPDRIRLSDVLSTPVV